MAKPGWSEMGGAVPVSREAMVQICEVFIQEIVHAAKAEFTRRKWPLTSPDGRTKITESFKYRVGGDGTIQISSSFPGLENYATGIPIKRDAEGNLIIHHGPLQLDNLWIHPGVGKRNFLYVGMEKGRESAKPILLQEVWNYLSQGDPFK